MIVQYRITGVVMLTKLVEKGVERCTQYWPDKLNMPESYGDCEVTLREQLKCGDYVKRVFDVMSASAVATAAAQPVAESGVSGVPSTPGTAFKSRRVLSVTQYYYPEWPVSNLGCLDLYL